jgi:hypothetical protein
MWFRSKKGDFIIISSAITTVVYGRGQHPPARAGASRRFSSKSATNSGSELLRVLRPGSDGPRGDFPHRPCLPVVAGGESTSENLALACVSCSLRKGARLVTVDPHTGEEAISLKLHTFPFRFQCVFRSIPLIIELIQTPICILLLRLPSVSNGTFRVISLVVVVVFFAFQRLLLVVPLFIELLPGLDP